MLSSQPNDIPTPSIYLQQSTLYIPDYNQFSLRIMSDVYVDAFKDDKRYIILCFLVLKSIL